MTELFFPNFCCSMEPVIGSDPETATAFRRCNGLGAGQRLLPDHLYCIPDDLPGNHAIITQLQFLDLHERRHLSDCVTEFGSLTLPLATFYDERLAKMARHSKGLVGAAATAATVRIDAFEKAVLEYENALFAFHEFERRRRGTGAERARLRQEVMLRSAKLDKIFRIELDRIVPRADIGKNRGTALTSGERGLVLARRSKGRGLNVTDQVQASRLVKFARAVRYVGKGAVVLDAGFRANDVRRSHQAGGDWMRETSVQMTGFGVGGALGGTIGRAAVVGGASLIAKMTLTLTPAGWVVLIAGGVTIGLAAGYAGDRVGKRVSSLIWDRGW